MARAITKCPDCGSTVSQFAAGCAVCGFDLVTARQELERKRASRPWLEVPAWFPQVTVGDAVLGALLILVAFSVPIVGGPIAGLFAYFAHQKGDTVQRNLALVAVAVALIVVIAFSFLPGTWDLLLPWVNLQGPLPT